MNIYGVERRLRIGKSEYQKGGNAYQVYEYDKEMEFWFPWCNLSVWLEKVADNEFYVDVNNCNSEIVDYLLDNEYIKVVDYRLSGFVTYPLVEVLKEIEGLEM